MKKNIFFILIIVLLCFIIGGYFLWQIFIKNNQHVFPSDFVKEKIRENNEMIDKKIEDNKILNNNKENISLIKNMQHIITIKTNMGEIRFMTYDADAPKTVNNFITLTQKGFYDGTIFHRVIDGFMIQGGDPEGTGMGGPGYTFEDELNSQTDSYKEGYKKGVVAMANAGPNTNGSQFFIMTDDYPLPNNYTIFGKVISGQEVVDKIVKTKVGQNDRPISPIIMEKVSVLEFKN